MKTTKPKAVICRWTNQALKLLPFMASMMFLVISLEGIEFMCESKKGQTLLLLMLEAALVMAFALAFLPSVHSRTYANPCNQIFAVLHNAYFGGSDSVLIWAITFNVVLCVIATACGVSTLMQILASFISLALAILERMLDVRCATDAESCLDGQKQKEGMQ